MFSQKPSCLLTAPRHNLRSRLGHLRAPECLKDENSLNSLPRGEMRLTRLIHFFAKRLKRMSGSNITTVEQGTLIQISFNDLLTAPILLPQESNQSSGTKNFDPVNRPIGQCFVLCYTAPDTAPASLRLAHPQPSRASEHGSQGQSKQGGCLKEIARGGYIMEVET